MRLFSLGPMTLPGYPGSPEEENDHFKPPRQFSLQCESYHKGKTRKLYLYHRAGQEFLQHLHQAPEKYFIT